MNSKPQIGQIVRIPPTYFNKHWYVSFKLKSYLKSCYGVVGIIKERSRYNGAVIEFLDEDGYKKNLYVNNEFFEILNPIEL